MMNSTELDLARYVSREPLPLAAVVLTGQYVRLEPLTRGHHAALCAVGLDEELWRWNPLSVKTAEDMEAYVDAALQEQAEGKSLPFVTALKESGQIVGGTRFGNIDRQNRRVEIGWTWIGRPWQRTAVNTEAKYLMLAHAFEKLGCLRVEFKTDFLNERSRRAILRLGAKEEGVFRNHMITMAGRVRHSVYYSITDTEWPAIKAALQQKLEDVAPKTETLRGAAPSRQRADQAV
ncbi:MAG: GNAT family N-acetyltransferase [bacterium]